MQFHQNRAKWTGFALMALVLLMAAAFVLSHSGKKPVKVPKPFHGTLLREPKGVLPFALTGVDGQPFTNDSLQGQWTILFFGFTHCGYLCPTTLSQLAKMQRLLEEKGSSPLPKVVFVSLDSKRDTLLVLKNYIRGFHPNFYAARGDDDSVSKMAREMGVAYAKVMAPKRSDPDAYDIQHGGTLMLFNPQGALAAFFTTPHHAELLAEDYNVLIG